MNNFLHINFSRLGMDLELKFRGSFYELKSRKFWLKILGDMEFDETWPTASFIPLIERKNKFQVNMGQEFEISLKVEFGLIS
jgi:hypothetical protein